MDTINVKGMAAEQDVLTLDVALLLKVVTTNAKNMVVESDVLNRIVKRAHQTLLTNVDDTEEATVAQIALHG